VHTEKVGRHCEGNYDYLDMSRKEWRAELTGLEETVDIPSHFYQFTPSYEALYLPRERKRTTLRQR
jgi:hypothetical protein